MELLFLGTSGCIPTKERNLPGVLVEYLDEPFLFDCGEGSQRQMRCAGVNFMRINHIFITHLHADHFMGLPGLIQSMDFLERDRDLHIYGPAGIRDTVDHLLSAGTFELDSFKVEVHEVDEGVILEDDRFKVSCARTIHTKHSLAYAFTENPHRVFQKQKALDMGIPEGRLFSKLQHGETVEVDGKKYAPDDVLGEPQAGRKIVYTGDTRASEHVAEFARGADVLIHEATFSEEEKDKLADAAHSTARQAAEVAVKAGARRLYLVHFSQRYTEPELLEAEAREVFPESYVAQDLARYRIEKHW